MVGLFTSCLAYIGEMFRWPSFLRFSVTTKVPIQIFGVNGPLVMVGAVIYLMLVVYFSLLAPRRGTGFPFYITTMWSIIFIELGFDHYKTWIDMCTPVVDIVLHAVNAVIITYSFLKLNYFPVTFLLGGSFFWGMLVLARVCSKAKTAQRAANSPSRDPVR